jgi:hypothetical protein
VIAGVVQVPLALPVPSDVFDELFVSARVRVAVVVAAAALVVSPAVPENGKEIGKE